MTPLRIGLVVPHIFMQDAVLPHVIFSPAQLALQLADELQVSGQQVTLYTPGKVTTSVQNITADLSLFEQELTVRDDSYIDLLKKHPGTFISLARQVQSEIISKAYLDANDNKLDIVHIYTNEEDTALPFAALCNKPVVFTHHDPFSFLIKYKNNFPKYKQLNWIALSESQKKGMPAGTNWLATIFHGLPLNLYQPNYEPKGGYVAYLGRIIESKGVHLAIAAITLYNQTHSTKLKLKIAGKHYSGHIKDAYWKDQIEPSLGQNIEYTGYLSSSKQKQDFLSDADALIIPSTFEEPFGMVMLESLACGTPVIGLDSGAIPEVIEDGLTGLVVKKSATEGRTVQNLATALDNVGRINRKSCRQNFESRFTSQAMTSKHLELYQRLQNN